MAMLWLGTSIYPEYFADIDLRAEVISFYREHLGVEVDEERYQTILSGRGLLADDRG